MDEVIHALNHAETDAELNAALLRATPYNDSHLVRDAIIAAQPSPNFFCTFLAMAADMPVLPEPVSEARMRAWSWSSALTHRFTSAVWEGWELGLGSLFALESVEEARLLMSVSRFDALLSRGGKV